MKTWKSKILIAALALTASPAVAQQQGTPSLQSAPPAASARSQEQTQTSPTPTQSSSSPEFGDDAQPRRTDGPGISSR